MAKFIASDLTEGPIKNGAIRGPSLSNRWTKEGPKKLMPFFYEHAQQSPNVLAEYVQKCGELS